MIEESDHQEDITALDLIIFTIIILNSFSGSLPISSSFIWTSVFLVCSFICVAFHCLFFLVTLPLGFSCGFISTSASGSSTGVCSWGCPGGLGFAPVRARCGGGAAAGATGAPAAPGTQGSWRLGQRETQCSRRAWRQYWPTRSSVLSRRTPRWQKTGRPQATGSQRVGHARRDPACPDAGLLLPVAALPLWGWSVKLAQQLGLWGPWWHQVCRDMGCLHRTGYVPIRVFFPSLL